MSPPKPAIVFILGPPGSGKGTLCTQLTLHTNLPVQHISVGDLLRKITQNTSHPHHSILVQKLEAQQLIDSTILTPILKQEIDDLISQAPSKRCILIDGFPRNQDQLMGYEVANLPRPILVLSLTCPEDAAKFRFLQRRRSERDDEIMFAKRYAEYAEENPSLEEYYQDVLFKIDADRSKKDIWESSELDMVRSKIRIQQ